MTVTQIEPLDKGRITVHLDNGCGFTVYKKEVRELSLTEGAELTEEQYRRLQNEILLPRAKKRAMHLLEKMDRTEAQLREKLRQNHYQEEIIDEALSYVKRYHYIDDLRYAQGYVRYRCQSKSRRRLTLELSQKGVAKEYIEQALAEEYQEENESGMIKKWLEKKHYDREQADLKEKQKLYQFLLRKGFCSEDIRKFL